MAVLPHDNAQRATRDHEDESFDAFCLRFHPRLVGALGLQTGDRALAEDLAQDALTKAFGRWNEVRHARSPEAWVLRVAFNLSNSWFRRMRMATRRGGLAATAEAEREHDSALRLSLRDALATLPPRQRQAVVLRFYGDLSVVETATAMDCAEGTVRALTSQAVAALRERLTGIDLETLDD